MASVLFRNATTIQGNNTAQAFTLPTVLPGDFIVLGVGWVQGGGATISMTGTGNWIHQGVDSVIAAQMQMTLFTAISLDGSESGGSATINVSVAAKLACFCASYSGVNLANPLALSTPQYAQNTTSNTTSATSPSVSPVPGSLTIEAFTSKSSTNASYSATSPTSNSPRASVFGAGGGAVDMAMFDSNGPVTSGGGNTSTLGTATANKIAMSLVLNAAPARGLYVMQAVKRAAIY